MFADYTVAILRPANLLGIIRLAQAYAPLQNNVEHVLLLMHSVIEQQWVTVG